ncbi:MAG: BsuPI-related putative proteinase inhibitor [Anaerobacillus sp.]|uniref:BsuPI-related putative proteinase inhibitor n=1 Tax=Anaerobacillus sp. TaxID=1872506 RepID=UPI003918E99C
MLKVVSIMFAFFLFILGCGTEIESINYDDDATGVKATFNIEEVGDRMRFELSLTNEGDEKTFIQFPSGQQFEIIVRNQDNQEVYRYSDGKMFTMALVMREIAPSETLVWRDEWEEATPGLYTVTGELQIMSINGESVDREQFKIEKTIQIKE